MPRFFFTLPEADRPVGGLYVALQMVDILTSQGFEAYPLYGSEDYRYPFAYSDMPGFYDSRLDGSSRKKKIGQALRSGDLGQVTRLLSSSQAETRKGKNTPLDVRPDDVFFLTEYNYDQLRHLFPDGQSVLLSQDVFGTLYAAGRYADEVGKTVFPCHAGIATSEACERCLGRFIDGPVQSMRIGIETAHLEPSGPKKLQVAYMPRKRAKEAQTVISILKASPALADYDFVPIESMSLSRAHEAMRDSLIFLSFSRQEGLGLPPIEAMAAECLVIGYSGFGGDEYFTPETGIKITEGDPIGFIEQVESVAQEYRDNSTRLDARRKKAATWARDRYSMEKMQVTLLNSIKALIPRS